MSAVSQADQLDLIERIERIEQLEAALLAAHNIIEAASVREAELLESLEEVLSSADLCDCSADDTWCPLAHARTTLAKYKQQK